MATEDGPKLRWENVKLFLSEPLTRGTDSMRFPEIEKANMLSVSIINGAYVSSGMTVMRTMLKLQTIIEVLIWVQK